MAVERVRRGEEGERLAREEELAQLHAEARQVEREGVARLQRVVQRVVAQGEHGHDQLVEVGQRARV